MTKNTHLHIRAAVHTHTLAQGKKKTEEKNEIITATIEQQKKKKLIKSFFLVSAQLFILCSRLILMSLFLCDSIKEMSHRTTTTTTEIGLKIFPFFPINWNSSRITLLLSFFVVCALLLLLLLRSDVCGGGGVVVLFAWICVCEISSWAVFRVQCFIFLFSKNSSNFIFRCVWIFNRKIGSNCSSNDYKNDFFFKKKTHLAQQN